MSVELLPAESLALTVGLAQVKRGEQPMPNISAMCILALARATGLHDWTKESAAPAPETCACIGFCQEAANCKGLPRRMA